MTARKKPEDKLKVGRPTSFKEEYCEMVFKLALLGLKDSEMASVFGVSEQTLNSWKEKFPKFLESLIAGKDKADAEVAVSLYKRACGYSHPAVKIFNDNGSPLIIDYTEHYPPDTGAATLWLKNRQKNKWRDKVEQEISGPDGGPVEVKAINIIGKATSGK